MGKTRIQIVEDEGIIAKDIQGSLENLGYVVASISSSGKEAIKKAEEEHPDLTLMDIVLRGDMDGIQTAQEICSRMNLPVVFLTAYADEEIIERAKITGPFGYLLKPFEERELHVAIEMALYRHQLEKNLRESEGRFKRAKEQAEEATKLKDKFVSLVSHDLRSPFASIFSFTQILLNDSEHPLHSEHREIIERIQGNSSRMLTMVEELLQISRLQTGSIVPQHIFMDARHSTAVAMESLDRLAQDKVPPPALSGPRPAERRTQPKVACFEL